MASATMIRCGWSLTRHGIADENLRVLSQNRDGKTVIVTGQSRADRDRIDETSPRAITWALPEDAEGSVNLADLLRHIGAQKIVDLLVEGGAETFSAFIHAGLVDKYLIVTAPKLLGDGRCWFHDQGRRVDQALNLRLDRSYVIGGDLWTEAYPR